MFRIGLVAVLSAALGVEAAGSGHVVAWGDSTSPLIRQFPDSLSAPRWIRACGNRSVAYRSNRKLSWWGANATIPTYSPSGRFLLRSLSCSEEIWMGLTDSGTVVNWGPAPAIGNPTPPVGLKNVVQIAVGTFHAAALKADGSVVAWGARLDSAVAETDGKTGIRAIAAAGVQTILLRQDSTVDVAGGTLTTVEKVPVGLHGVVAVATGARHALALKSDGTVVAWGDSTENRLKVPVDLDSVVAIAAGGNHSLALRADGSVVCWGRNVEGQCTVPPSVVDVVELSAGTAHSLALRRDGVVVGWGSNAQGQLDVPFHPVPVASLHMGRDAAAAILEDGRLIAWGAIPSAPVPTLPVGRTWKNVSFGTTPHALGIDDQGTPYAWGTDVMSVGIMPDSLVQAVEVEASRYLSLVLRPDHRLVVWGEDNDGIVTGSVDEDSVVGFDASEYRVVSVHEDSSVRMWGKLIYSTDTVPSSARGALAVAAGDQSFLALTRERTVVAWNPRPALAAWHVPPAGLDSVVAISAGSVHALALREGGRIVCWGDTADARCAVPTDLPPAATALAGSRVSLALVPTLPAQGVPTGVERRPRILSGSRVRATPAGLRLVGRGEVTVSVFNIAGRPVLASQVLREGEVLGASLREGVYLVRVAGEPGATRWIRTAR